jgi:transposase InsO family protein
VKNLLGKKGDARTQADGRHLRHGHRRAVGAPSVSLNRLRSVEPARSGPASLACRDRRAPVHARRAPAALGNRRLYRLLRCDGAGLNRKLAQRAYRKAGLVVRRRKRRLGDPANGVAMPTRAHQRRSMDFVSDALGVGRKFRARTIVDDSTRESPAIEVDTSLPGERVVRVLERWATTRGLPQELSVTTRLNSAARHWTSRADARGVVLQFIQSGKPIQNAFAESFNGRFRDECLNGSRIVSRSGPGGSPVMSLARTGASPIDPRRICQRAAASYTFTSPITGLTPFFWNSVRCHVNPAYSTATVVARTLFANRVLKSDIVRRCLRNSRSSRSGLRNALYKSRCD